MESRASATWCKRACRWCLALLAFLAAWFPSRRGDAKAIAARPEARVVHGEMASRPVVLASDSSNDRSLTLGVVFTVSFVSLHTRRSGAETLHGFSRQRHQVEALIHRRSGRRYGRLWVISRPVSAASFARCHFQARTREPLDPPPSAVINSFVAFGNRARPMVSHQRRIDATANSAVSAVSPTLTHPSSLLMS